jgi:death-on-curing protein
VNAANQHWVWLNLSVIQLVHEEQLAEHGGPAGVRDEGMLASAMGRPQNRAMYESPDAATLAASYAFGNKRTAFVAMETFLDLNGFELLASDEDCVLKTLGLAAGEIDEASFAQWIREHLAPRSP